jgi:putative phage-type endonuclease
METKETLNPIVEQLLQRPQPEQRSPQWYATRNQMVTASDWGAVLGENPYSTYNKVLAAKARPDEKKFMGNAATAWGQKYEPIMNMIYERRNNVRVLEFGLLQHPVHSFLGASPDGITEGGVMVEIKCPSSREITGIPPRYYWCQVQGQIEVCNLEVCDFIEGKFVEWQAGDEMDEGTLEKVANKSADCRERGMFLMYLHKKTKEEKKYTSPVFDEADQQGMDDWVDTRTRELGPDYILMDREYWQLTLFSKARIERDRNWFAAALPRLDSFWKAVLKMREDIANGLAPETTPKKKRTPNAKITNSKFGFANIPNDEDDVVHASHNVFHFDNPEQEPQQSQLHMQSSQNIQQIISPLEEIPKQENQQDEIKVKEKKRTKKNQDPPSPSNIANTNPKNKKQSRTSFNTPLTSYPFF